MKLIECTDALDAVRGGEFIGSTPEYREEFQKQYPAWRCTLPVARALVVPTQSNIDKVFACDSQSAAIASERASAVLKAKGIPDFGPQPEPQR